MYIKLLQRRVCIRREEEEIIVYMKRTKETLIALHIFWGRAAATMPGLKQFGFENVILKKNSVAVSVTWFLQEHKREEMRGFFC